MHIELALYTYRCWTQEPGPCEYAGWVMGLVYLWIWVSVAGPGASPLRIPVDNCTIRILVRQRVLSVRTKNGRYQEGSRWLSLEFEGLRLQRWGNNVWICEKEHGNICAESLWSIRRRKADLGVVAVDDRGKAEVLLCLGESWLSEKKRR